MSACHLKNKNWKRAQETADKVGSPLCSSSWVPTPRIGSGQKREQLQGHVPKSQSSIRAGLFRARSETARRSEIEKPSRYFFVRFWWTLRLIRFSDAALAEAELVRLRAIDKERERINNKKLKGTRADPRLSILCSPNPGFLNKAEKKTDDKTEEVVGQIQSATIEEVNDDGTPVASTSSA